MSEQKPGYIFNASMQIGQSMALTVSGNLPLDANAKTIESELDRIFDAMSKQETKRMKIPAVKGELKEQEDALVRTKKQYEELVFQEQGRRLNNAEKAQMDTCDKQIKFLTTALEKGGEILAALEKEAA